MALVAAGADPTAANTAGQTPLDLHSYVQLHSHVHMRAIARLTARVAALTEEVDRLTAPPAPKSP